MGFTDRMKTKAKSLKRRLVLPEGTEPRTLQAARIIMDEGLAGAVTLIGTDAAVLAAAGDAGVSLAGITVVDPAGSPDLTRYAAEYVELRKHKGMTQEAALKEMLEPLKWGAMMVRLNDADGMVAGAESATAAVLLASFTIIKTSPGTRYASSCFVMEVPDRTWGADGHMVFSDCATIPDPTAEQLAEIAIAAAESCRSFLDVEPAVAMLSFSTMGSAEHPDVDKVREATRIAREKRPDIAIDGELQADAALVESVGKKKAPTSSVAGRANVLVFPDLNSGNIGYKLVQRLAKAEAYGPFLQGFAKPVSDLSRGCSVADIVNTSAATLCQGVDA
ncbi:MAG: phosphate acetyltransferase [Spirochaetaceae bacterium]|nr:MAG: phosphate acetyltransferase [Spirochaetaceae bacterium]